MTLKHVMFMFYKRKIILSNINTLKNAFLEFKKILINR